MHNMFNKIFFFPKQKLSHLLRGKNPLKYQAMVMYFVFKIKKFGKQMFNSRAKSLPKPALLGSCNSKYQEDKVVTL